MPKIPETKASRDDSPEALRVYLFHGLDVQYKRGAKDAVSECPFCGREGKLNINVTSSKFGCVVCGEAGNQYIFLRKLHDLAMKNTPTSDYELLRKDRNLLSADTLIQWGIAKSPINQKWLVPGYNEKGALTNLYQYRFNGERMMLMPTPTVGHAIMGMGQYDAKKPVTVICEGVWDGASLFEILERTESVGEDYASTEDPSRSLLSDKNVLSIPAALVYKEAWLPLFKGQTVILMAQNDHPHENRMTGTKSAPASYSGMERIARMGLGCKSSKPTEMRLLTWGPEGYDLDLASGYDTRDALTSSGGLLASRIACLQKLEAKILPIPAEWASGETSGSGGKGSKSTGEALKPLLCSDDKILVSG